MSASTRQMMWVSFPKKIVHSGCLGHTLVGIHLTCVRGLDISNIYMENRSRIYVGKTAAWKRSACIFRYAIYFIFHSTPLKLCGLTDIISLFIILVCLGFEGLGCNTAWCFPSIFSNEVKSNPKTHMWVSEIGKQSVYTCLQKFNSTQAEKHAPQKEYTIFTAFLLVWS